MRWTLASYPPLHRPTSGKRAMSDGNHRPKRNSNHKHVHDDVSPNAPPPTHHKNLSPTGKNSHSTTNQALRPRSTTRARGRGRRDPRAAKRFLPFSSSPSPSQTRPVQAGQTTKPTALITTAVVKWRRTTLPQSTTLRSPSRQPDTPSNTTSNDKLTAA